MFGAKNCNNPIIEINEVLIIMEIKILVIFLIFSYLINIPIKIIDSAK